MKYDKDKVISNIYETSKSADGSYLLEARYRDKNVYSLDHLKEEFCEKYRKAEYLHSCDVYFEHDYGTHKDSLAIEFKNTTKLRLKKFFDSFYGKSLDTHMILLETFWKNKKVKEISKKADLLIVYKNGMSDSENLKKFYNQLHEVEPLQGNKDRRSQKAEMFANDEEAEVAITQFKDCFTGRFYKSVEFIDKKDFIEMYVDSGYLDVLSENPNIEWQ